MDHDQEQDDRHASGPRPLDFHSRRHAFLVSKLPRASPRLLDPHCRCLAAVAGVGQGAAHGRRCPDRHQPGGHARPSDFAEQRHRGDRSRGQRPRRLECARRRADRGRDLQLRLKGRDGCLPQQQSKRLHLAHRRIHHPATLPSRRDATLHPALWSASASRICFFPTSTNSGNPAASSASAVSPV